MTYAVLVPIYGVFFTVARVWQILGRDDPLQLRDDGRPSFWLPCNRRITKSQFASRMFLKEEPRPAGIRRLVPLAASLLLLLLLGEGVLQYWGFGHPLLYVNDAQIGYYPAPDQEIHRYGGVVKTNRFGMRSPNISKNKSPGTFRVFMIGDSTLYGGSYIDQEELYSRLLENQLKKRFDNDRVEVLAMGVNAWGPLHELEYVKKFGTFDADIAVICLPIGDIYRRCYGIASLANFTPQRPPICAYEELARHVLWRYFGGTAGRESEESREIQGERGIEAYVELGRHFRDAGCEVFFEILPSKELGALEEIPEADTERIATQIRDVTRLESALVQAGFANVAFPQGLLIGKGSIETLYHDSCHLHYLGHRLYADYLADQLLSRSTSLAHWKNQSIIQARKEGGSREHLRR